MKKEIRMVDIAESLNVSVVTVSNALNDREGVSPELRAAIKKAADELGYKYTVNEKIIPKIENRNIGIVMSERFVGEKGTFYWRLCQETSKELLKKNLFAINETLSKEDEKACVLPKIISENKVSGLIVLGQIRRSYIEMLIKHDIPMIFLDFYDKHYSVDSVVTDNFYGMYLLTDYLIENGHRSIGFVGNVNATSSIQDRYLGYVKALMENEIDMPLDNIPKVIDDRDEFGLNLKELKFPEQMPTAFVCNCDETAFRVITALKSKGLRVPEDISVVGFDNFIVSDVCDPPITTVEVNMKAMAEETVETMIRKLENKKYKSGRKIILGKLILKESVKKLN
ncbi:MAG: LacI family DNA-binding transcriptional regulator [Oscillospiraceae bacterium]|nr:LacI family transcriptional regulator [Ruminococcus sp.]MBP1566679.1 LacI family DNA-binding transcriptional regulator [Oscillospiraceae bacterium]MBQ9981719.1 LacI family DNA-binding transcriptional regulator [Oscillospiraceae bacterium]